MPGAKTISAQKAETGAAPSVQAGTEKTADKHTGAVTTTEKTPQTVADQEVNVPAWLKDDKKAVQEQVKEQINEQAPGSKIDTVGLFKSVDAQVNATASAAVGAGRGHLALGDLETGIGEGAGRTALDALAA